MNNFKPGDRICVSEMGYELEYRVLLVDSSGIHVHLINDPYRHFLLVARHHTRDHRNYTLYQKLNPVDIRIPNTNQKVVPSYNPEIAGLHPEQDCPV